MQWIRQKKQGLIFRLRNIRYGILFFSSNSYRIPKKLWVRGKLRPLRFTFQKANEFYYEFREICLEDCYNLAAINNSVPVSTIVDIGANQGLFLLAARKKFPGAVIQGYEPNPQLKDLLEQNARQINASVFMEAVADYDGKMQLQLAPGETDLHATTVRSEEGNIPAVSFHKVIERAGGKIDLLKLDCEGGEWPLLEMSELWQHINAVTMEYHLWAKPGMTTDKLITLLQQYKFKVIKLSPVSDTFGLLTAIR